MTNLSTIQRIETAGLLVVAGLLALSSSDTLILDVGLIAYAINLARISFRAEQRKKPAEEAARLFEEGLRLYWAHRSSDSAITGAEPSDGAILCQYECQKWVDQTRAWLRAYPEFGAIFDASKQEGGIEMLIEHLRALHKIQGLLEVSRRVGLQRAS
jgi:hypothetical protein